MPKKIVETGQENGDAGPDEIVDDEQDDDVSRETEGDDTEGDDTEGDDTEGDDTEGGTEISRVRREAGKYRKRAREAEAQVSELQQQLFTARVAATGRLADPEDMPLNVDALDDPDALTEAIDDLLELKPHLRAREFGDIGQRDRGMAPGVSLASILRQNA